MNFIDRVDELEALNKAVDVLVDKRYEIHREFHNLAKKIRLFWQETVTPVYNMYNKEFYSYKIFPGIPDPIAIERIRVSDNEIAVTFNDNDGGEDVEYYPSRWFVKNYEEVIRQEALELEKTFAAEKKSKEEENRQKEIELCKQLIEKWGNPYDE